MQSLELTCPYCGAETTIEHDGLYTPRYHDCAECGERFIYEPRLARVDFFRLGEADCWSDPDCREIEMSAHAEM